MATIGLNKKLSAALEPAISTASIRFAQLQPRERILVATCAVVVSLAALFVLIVQPILHAKNAAAQRLEDARAIASRLELASALGAAPGVPSRGSNQSLLASVDTASKSADLGKPLSRLQPEGDAQVHAWIENVSFDALSLWMVHLQSQYGVRVEAVEIDHAEAPGTVNARLSLVRAR